MTISVSVSGDRDVIQRMEKVRRGLRTVTRQSINRGLTVIRKAVASEAPRGTTGNAKRAIGKRLTSGGEGQAVNGKVGPHVGKRKRRGAKSTDPTAPHAHLIVLGTKERFTKTGARRGVMPQNNFVDRGFAKSASQAQAVVTAAFDQKIQQRFQ